MATPMPRATRDKIVPRPSNSHGTGDAAPASVSRRSTARRDGSPSGAAIQASSRSPDRPAGLPVPAAGGGGGRTSPRGAERAPRRRERADHHPPGRVLGVGRQVGFGLFDQGQDAFGVSGQPPAGVGQLGPPGGPGQQSRPGLPLP